MGRHRPVPAPGRRGLLLLRLGLVVAATAGAVALTAPSSGPGAAAPAASTSSPAPVVRVAVSSAAADPVRVRVPAVGIDSDLARLGLDSAGALVPPTDFAQAGWFAEGTAPGDVGPAVLAGHVDSSRGPAVFYRLRELTAGAEVLVDRADGTTARFVVTEIARYPKRSFPTAEVYGPTPDAELRLITCGGAFDRTLRSYDDNVVVYAVLAD